MERKNEKTFHARRPFVPEEEIEKVFREHNATFPAHLKKTALSVSYGQAKKMYLRGSWEIWGKAVMVRLAKNYQPKEKIKNN